MSICVYPKKWLQNQNPRKRLQFIQAKHDDGFMIFRYFYHIPCKHIMNINYPNYYENKSRFKISLKHNMRIFQGSCLDQSRNKKRHGPWIQSKRHDEETEVAKDHGENVPWDDHLSSENRNRIFPVGFYHGFYHHQKKGFLMVKKGFRW